MKSNRTHDRACSIPHGSGGSRVSAGVGAPLAPGSAAARRQQASILVIVLWIVFGLISITIYFASSMTSEFRASDSRVAGIQSELAIEGARRYLTCVLSNLTDPGSLPDPSSYQNAGARVGDARFWLVGRSNAPTSISASTPIAFGFVDEASKINLNYASSNDADHAARDDVRSGGFDPHLAQHQHEQHQRRRRVGHLHAPQPAVPLQKRPLRDRG